MHLVLLISHAPVYRWIARQSQDQDKGPTLNREAIGTSEPNCFAGERLVSETKYFGWPHLFRFGFLVQKPFVCLVFFFVWLFALVFSCCKKCQKWKKMKCRALRWKRRPEEWGEKSFISASSAKAFLNPPASVSARNFTFHFHDKPLDCDRIVYYLSEALQVDFLLHLQMRSFVLVFEILFRVGFFLAFLTSVSCLEGEMFFTFII